MGKKKPKEREIPPGKDASSAPSSVFETLFGGITDQQSLAASIFSDNNPFKRKHEELRQGLGAPVDGTPIAESAKVETKKRKVDKEQEQEIEHDVVSAAEAPSEKVKSKKEKRGDFDGGKESKKLKKGAEMGPDLRVVSEAENLERASLDDQVGETLNDSGVAEKADRKDKGKKKKRKRDDLETLYESKKYGAEGGGEEEEANRVVGGKVAGKKRKKVDDAVDMSVTKEGFDDESKLLRTVFIGNLPLKIKKKVLVKEFGKFGEVESVRIRSVPILDTKTPRKGAVLQKKFNDAIDCVHAYIVFKSEESAQASVAHNMAVVGGNHIRVDRACPPRKKLKGENAPIYDNKRTVFVGNLPYDVKDEELYELFLNISNVGSSIEAIRVVRDPHTSLGKGIAYVLFKTRDVANLVAKKRTLKLRDRELRLSHAKTNSTPSKRSNPSAEVTSLTKKLATDSSIPNGPNKANKKISTSYQGLRASKVASHKKSQASVVRPVKSFQERTKKGAGVKDTPKKRPAVAARKAKAKAKALKEVGSSNQIIKKRKTERTPESLRPNKKKFKRFH